MRQRAEESLTAVTVLDFLAHQQKANTGPSRGTSNEIEIRNWKNSAEGLLLCGGHSATGVGTLLQHTKGKSAGWLTIVSSPADLSCPSWARTRTLLIQSRCRRGCGSGQVARKRSLTEHRCPLPYPKMPASARRNGSRNGSTSAHQLNRESTCFASRATSARVHLLSVVSEGKSAIGAKILQDFRAVSVSNHAHHIFAHLLRRRGIRPKHLHDP